MYIDKYGLTNSKVGESGAENGLLWTLEHVMLELDSGKTQSGLSRLDDLKASIDKCRIGQGVYMQNPSHVLKIPVNVKDRYMSPDQLIAIMLVSEAEGMTHHKDIFKKMIKQGLVRYNNMEDRKLRLIHPRDLLLYISLNVKMLAPLLLPILGLFCIISCMSKREKTSGKLLTWVKLSALENRYRSMKITKRICDRIIKKTHGSWSDVFSIYFNRPHHPIANLAHEVYSDD